MQKLAVRYASLAFALFSLVSAAQAAVTIDPPDGWKPVDLSSLPLKYEGAWAEPAHGADFAQSINLLKQTLPNYTLDEYVELNAKELKQMDSGLVFTLNERTKCGAGATQHVKYITTYGSRKLALEQLWAFDGTTFYVGTYTRLVDEPELPAASQALATLCAHMAAPPS